MSLAVAFTKEDDENATEYARYFYDAKKLELYRKELPHIFSHVTTRTEKQNDPINLPEDLTIYKLITTFNELGCQQASCFSVLPNKKNCTKEDKVNYVMLGDSTSKLCCQPACNFLSQYGPSFDLEWRKGKCVLSRNTNLYAYAMDPKLRAEKSITGFTNLPRGFDVYDEVMYPNKTYCNYFSKDYDKSNKECKKNWINFLVSELFTGDTIVAFFHRLINKEYVIADSEIETEFRIDPYKTVPEDLILYNWLNTTTENKEVSSVVGEYILGNWKERFENFKDVFKDFTFDMFLDSLINIETVQSMLLDYGFDYGKTITKKILSKLMGEILSSSIFKGFKKASFNIPKYLLRLAFKKTVAQSIIKTVSGAAIKLVTKTTALASSAVGYILAALSIIGMLLDLWDPYGLNNITDSVALLDLSAKLKSFLEEEYYDIFKGDPEDAFKVEYLYALFINPETKKDDYPEIEIECSSVFYDKYYEYLFKLKTNTSGQDLTWKENFPGNVKLNFDDVEQYNLSSIIRDWDVDFDVLYMQPRNIKNYILEYMVGGSAVILFFKSQFLSFLLIIIFFMVHYFTTMTTVDYYNKMDNVK